MILLSVENLFSHNAEHGTLNMELFKLSNPSNLSINADMSSTMSGCSPKLVNWLIQLIMFVSKMILLSVENLCSHNTEHGTLNTERYNILFYVLSGFG